MSRRAHNTPLTKKLLGELGFDPRDVRDTAGDGTLEIHGDTVRVEVLVRDKDGRIQKIRDSFGRWTAKVDVQFVPVDPGRLRQFEKEIRP